MKNKKLYRILLITCSLIISAFVYNIFLLPLNLVTGGTNGIATITYYLYGYNPAVIIFLLSIACLILSYMYLGREKTRGTVVACIAYPLLVEIVSLLFKNTLFDKTDMLVLIIFAGVLNGISNGLMYKSGYSNGGFPIISQILFEKFKYPVVKSSFIMNAIIVGIGASFFGITSALYAIIFLYINSLVLDRVLLGISNNKAFYIITDKDKEIKDYIIKQLNHTVTIFDVKGGFLNHHKDVMLTVVPSRDYYKLTEGIKAIDPSVFFVVTDSYQVEGAK